MHATHKESPGWRDSGQWVSQSPRLRLRKLVEEKQINARNVGTITGRGTEIAYVIARRKDDILCVQESR